MWPPMRAADSVTCGADIGRVVKTGCDRKEGVMSLLYCLFRAVSAAAAISVLLVGPVPAKESLELPLIPGLSTPEHTVDNAADHLDPEQATGRHEHSLVHGKRWMVSAANPLASQAGANMLRKGGSAVDAAIAMQWVLNLVEPQSSGLGG